MKKNNGTYVIKNPHLKAILITALGVLLLSLDSLFIKLTTTDALTFAFYMGFFMFLSINIVLFSTKKLKAISLYTLSIIPILISGSLFGISNIFFISAIKTTTVANTVLIIASGPLFSSLFAYLLYKEAIRKNIIISSIFIFIGLFVIFSSQLGSGDFIGNMYALLCTITFALSFVIMAKYPNVDRFAITAMAGFVSAFCSSFLVTSFLIDNLTLIVLLLSGLLVAPIARILIALGTKHLPASEVGLLMIIETIMAPIWVWLVLKEVPHDSTFVGGSIILLTVILNALYVIKIKKA